jgi:hypothetical protein
MNVESLLWWCWFVARQCVGRSLFEAVVDWASSAVVVNLSEHEGALSLPRRIAAAINWGCRTWQVAAILAVTGCLFKRESREHLRGGGE